MNKFLVFLGCFFRFIIYKPQFKKSEKFVIKSNSHILGCSNISVGNNFFANNNLRIEVFKMGVLEIKENVNCGKNVHIGVLNSVLICENVLIGSNILISDHNHGSYSGDFHDSPYSAPVTRKLDSKGKIVINRNVWIGDGVVILPNVEIGEGAIIGANSVISKNVPKNVIVGGNPAQILKVFNNESGRWERYTE